MKDLSIAANTAAGLPDSIPSDVAISEKPRQWRVVGSTEARLRAANKKAWLESTKGWSNFFGRFATFARTGTS